MRGNVRTGRATGRVSCALVSTRACYAFGMDRPTPATPPSPRLPWDYHPALQPERLRLCARLLANARRDALALAREELGDDAWSVGCRAYAFGRQRLRRVAEAGAHTWLRVLDGTQHFVFLIEDVPVRFYRGSADDPTARTLRRQEGESKQLGLALGRAEADGLVFRLAVETDETGAVRRVVFLALRGEEGAAECVWPVPLDPPATAQAGAGTVQLRLIGDEGGDGCEPARGTASRPLARKRAGGGR